MIKKLNVVKTFIEKYKKSPYSIGAERLSIGDKYAILRYKTNSDRTSSIKKLRKAGIPAKLMVKNTESKAFMYRYELTVWYK